MSFDAFKNVEYAMRALEGRREEMREERELMDDSYDHVFESLPVSQYSLLKDKDQTSEVGRWIERYNRDKVHETLGSSWTRATDTICDAVTEELCATPGYTERLAIAMRAGDVLEVGFIFDEILRRYIGKEIEQDWLDGR